jgi:hypothetical protein
VWIAVLLPYLFGHLTSFFCKRKDTDETIPHSRSSRLPEKHWPIEVRHTKPRTKKSTAKALPFQSRNIKGQRAKKFGLSFSFRISPNSQGRRRLVSQWWTQKNNVKLYKLVPLIALCHYVVPGSGTDVEPIVCFSELTWNLFYVPNDVVINPRRLTPPTPLPPVPSPAAAVLPSFFPFLMQGATTT